MLSFLLPLALTLFETLLETRIPSRPEHTPCEFAPLVHNPEGGHRTFIYWNVCGFCVRETFSILLFHSTMSHASP
jgi:hypothetical protein